MDPSLRLAVQKLLNNAFERATTLLSESSDCLEVISVMLQRHHHLAGSVVGDILQGEYKPSNDPIGYETTDSRYTTRAAEQVLRGFQK